MVLGGMEETDPPKATQVSRALDQGLTWRGKEVSLEQWALWARVQARPEITSAVPDLLFPFHICAHSHICCLQLSHKSLPQYKTGPVQGSPLWGFSGSACYLACQPGPRK